MQRATLPHSHPRRGLCPEHPAAAGARCTAVPSGSVHACPSLHSHFKNIICLRVSGCLMCAWPGSVAHRRPWQPLTLCRLAHPGCARAGVPALPHTPSPACAGTAELKKEINLVPAFAPLCSFPLSPFPFASFSIFN